MSAEQKLTKLSLDKLESLAASLGLDVGSFEGNRRHKATYITPILGAMTEESLSQLSLVELQSVVGALGVDPEGNFRHKASYVMPIMTELSASEPASPAPEEPASALMPRRPLLWRAIATIAVVALVLGGIFFLARLAARAQLEQVSTSAAAEEVVAPAETEVSTPIVELEEIQETPAPTATPVPALLTELTSAEVLNTEVFTYTPGGPNYAWPEEGAVEEFEDGWHRIRQAANGEYLPWTFQSSIAADHPLEEVAQWDSATKLLLTNPTTETLQVRVELRRDFEVEEAYDQAQPGTLGLGWFIAGSLTNVTVGDKTEELKGLGVLQMGFPREWESIWEINLKMDPGAQVTLNQGARRTSTDTWPLPEAN